MKNDLEKMVAVKKGIIWNVQNHDIVALRKYFSVDKLHVKIKLWMLNHVIKAYEDTKSGTKEEYYNIFLESTTMEESKKYLRDKVTEFGLNVSVFDRGEILRAIGKVPNSDVDGLLEVYHTIHDTYNIVHADDESPVQCSGASGPDFP